MAKTQHILICLAITMVTLAIYARTYGFEFVRYDDRDYGLNPHVRNGLTVEAMKWALVSMDDANWLPLTRLSHELDASLFGVRSGTSHLVNALLHTIASLMVFWFLLRATGSQWSAAFAGMMFAVHPLHVESVAWVAERKDVLCAVFWFATLWSWVGYTARPGRGRYQRTLLFFCLALLSKPMAVTLPVVLFLLDFWPLGRALSRRTVVEKIPFAVLAAIDAGLTIVAQRGASAIKGLGTFGAGLRIENALLSWAEYALTTIWPNRLAVFYPHPASIPVWKAVACGVAVAGISLLVVRGRRRFPWLLTGWFWFLITTLPVIGLLQVGRQARADRYMYIPMVGLATMAAFSVRWNRLTASVAVVVLLGWSVAAWRQTGYWRNSEALFTQALSVTENNDTAYENLAAELAQKPGRVREAIPLYRAAIRIRPEAADLHLSLCAALPDPEEGIEECDIALKLDPANWQAHSNRGGRLDELGRRDAAIAEFRTATRLAPGAARAHNNLAWALFTSGQLQESLKEGKAALALDPDLAAAHYNQGRVLLAMGDARGAAAEFEETLRIEPGSSEAHNMHGAALSKLPGGMFEALDEFQAALRLNPRLAEARANFAYALFDAGRAGEAAAQMKEAVRLRPNPEWVSALTRFGADKR